MLIEVLRAAADEVGERHAIVSSEQSITYRTWLERAETCARGLEARSAKRFACIVDDVGDLLALLCASSATGSEACVYRSSVEPALALELAEAFDHDTIVTDRPGLVIDDRRVIPFSELMAVGATETNAIAPSGASPTLILTTGTTGRPKGARHDWGRLLAGVRSRSGPSESRWLLAYNLNQFAGLQVFLHALANWSTLVVPPGNQPQVAIPFALEHGVTHVSATPTFWRFAVALLDEQRAAAWPLRQITLGGEAVPAPLLEDLRRLFPQARISQIYASTESGSTVSVRDARNGLPIAVLDRSEDDDVQMKVVDGELHIRSRVGMLGYYGDSTEAGDWRPTGDLVEIRGDRIHFVGRTSEVINVGGVKIHPLPVEEVVLAVPGVVAAHAYGRSSPVSGQIVAVDVVAGDGVDTETLEDDVRAACGDLPPAARPRRIRFVDELDVRDQKVVRRGAAGGDRP